MIEWYLDHSLAIAGWFLVAGIVASVIGLTYRELRRGDRQPARRALLLGGALVGEAVLHSVAMVIWTDPDAIMYGMNWRGLTALAILAFASPVAALWLALRQSSRPRA